MPDGSARPKHLFLLVSDDPAVQEDLRYGTPLGVEVAFARDAREGRAALEDNGASLVIVDLQTGSAGGFALARDMAYSDKLRDVPVFMLLERDQDAWLARQAGARLYRTKPIESAQLVADALTLV